MSQTDNRVRVLISEGSSNSARQAIYGLGRKFCIDVLDPSPWCQCRFSSLVRNRIPCPRVGKDPVGYVKFVAQLASQGRHDVLFPTHEQVYVFAKFRDAFQRHIGLAVPSFEAISRVQSKAQFAELMNQLGLPTPETRICYSRSELTAHDDFPCYVKLVHSTASMGVRLVGNPTELIATADQFLSSGDWSEGSPIVIQQPAPGRQAAVSAVLDRGRLVGIACADVLQTGIGGGPALKRTADHPLVVQHVEQLGRHLQWHGPISLEYFYNADAGQPYYIEINPRISEALYGSLSGVNLYDATVRISLGEHVERLPDAKPGLISHNGFIVMIADAYNGASRRQLLRRLWNHWTQQDIYRDSESEMTRPREDWLSLIPATAVISRLLVSPASAKMLARNTVDNYSLPETAATRIDALDPSALDDLLP